MDELLRKVKELEEENFAVKSRLSGLEKKRSPLSPLPVGEQQQNAHGNAKDNPVSSDPQRADKCGSVDPDFLYYLKSILGYSIKLDGSTMILRSVYAFCNEDVFEVEIRDKKLIFKNTDYLQEWKEDFNTYIVIGRSYCAFFAAVTLNLFNRKTFG